MILKYPQLIKLGTLKLSDHNRSPLSVSQERIEKKQRMHNGRMRKMVIADKRSYSVSWSMLPAFSTHTVDNCAGAEDMETLYLNTKGKINLYIVYNNTPAQDEPVHEVMLSSFSKEIVNRGITTFYEVSLSFEEV